ncbi:AIPR family protein [Wansuia hejianensis]|uniref:AIPR family protein n=1 Tax=Wansuia hejianensis TaxID=2763667 RepID=A0A926IHF8_9FIRM|nr:AIPR family protein [Wansuia hejianensis]MBC8590622.1 AIPR family protein [Wansuia hejianensis]
MKEFRMKAKSFKRMEDPINRNSNRVKYVCYIKADSIPLEFDDWMLTNPREQKMTTNVANKIVESLDENQYFHELNRGILMSVSDIKYDNSDGIVIIRMDNPEIHGNIDGGHTLRAILNAKSKNILSSDRYVFFEVFTGIDSPVELAAARNTSVQVDLKSIAELENSFEVIKEAFSKVGFKERISYKMNEHSENKDIDPIDVREVIAIINMFSQTLYPYKTSRNTLSETHPVQSYTGKEASLKKFLNLGKNKRERMIKDMMPIIPDIFKLWDTIECNFAAESNKAGKRYGTRKYSKYNNDEIVDYSMFSESPLKYSIPKGIMYPIVGAFRALAKVDESTGQYSWIKDPLEVWNAIGGKLSTIILDEKSETPNDLGKNNNLWSNLFKEVYIYGYMSQI